MIAHNDMDFLIAMRMDEELRRLEERFKKIRGARNSDSVVAESEGLKIDILRYRYISWINYFDSFIAGLPEQLREEAFQLRSEQIIVRKRLDALRNNGKTGFEFIEEFRVIYNPEILKQWISTTALLGQNLM